MLFQEISASSLLKVDHEGNILLPSPYPFNKAGFVIHGAVHMGRPDVQCVIHLHTRDGVAVAAQKDGLLPLSQHAMFCLPYLSYHDYEGIALDYAGLGRRRVGDKQAAPGGPRHGAHAGDAPRGHRPQHRHERARLGRDAAHDGRQGPGLPELMLHCHPSLRSG